MQDIARLKREKRQLRRLVVLIDVIFAVVIWRAFMLLPRPTDEEWNFETIGDFLLSSKDELLIVFVAIIVVIVYWIQSNMLFGNLERTNNKHTVLSILQIFFLLMFLFVVRLGIAYEGNFGAKILESISAALVGIAAAMAWGYAIRDHRLLSADMTAENAEALRIRVMAEPITAIVTIPCAFIGPVFWELAWLLYPLWVYVLKLKQNRK